MSSPNCRDCKFCVPSKTPIFWFSTSRWTFSGCNHPSAVAHHKRIGETVGRKWTKELPYSSVAAEFSCGRYGNLDFFEAKPVTPGVWGKLLRWMKWQ